MKKERPRGELFRDPAALPVWAGVQALDEASQHDVLDALELRLATWDTRKGTHNQNRARAIAALRKAAKMLCGASPSVAEYRRLRNENPDLGWPPESSLRRWLGGGWNDALEQAHLERVPEPLAAEPTLGRSFSPQEVITALKECAKDLGHVPSFEEYLPWTRRPDVRSRPGRRPGSMGVVTRKFGGWGEALEAAGMVKDAADVKPFRNGHGNEYTEEEMFLAMRRISEHIDGRVPSVAEYSSIGRRIRDEAKVEGRSRLDVGIPAYNTCSNRFGSWKKFKTAYIDWSRRQEEDE